MTQLNSYIESFPSDFFKRIDSAIKAAYKESHRHVSSSFHEREAQDLLPHYRRGLIENELYEIGISFDGLKTERVFNKRKTSTHVEIRSSRLIITQSWTHDPTIVIRPAQFRTTLAESNQLELFKHDIQRKVQTHNTLFAMVVHGSCKKIPAAPDFVFLAFPDSKYKYWTIKISLNKIYIPNTVSIENTDENLAPLRKFSNSNIINAI